MFPIIKTKYLREYYEYEHGSIRAAIDTQLEFFSVNTNFKINYDKEIMEFKYPASNDKLFREKLFQRTTLDFKNFQNMLLE